MRDTTRSVSSRGRWCWLAWTVAVALVLPAGAAAQPEEEPVPEVEAPAEEPAPEVRTAALTTARAEALALYFERCAVGAGDEAAVAAVGDWDGLIGLGYTPEDLLALAREIPQDCAHHSFLTVILAVESGVSAGAPQTTPAEPEGPPAPTWSAEEERALRDRAVDSFLEHCYVDFPYEVRRAAWVDWDSLIGQGYTPQRIDDIAQGLTEACDHRSFASAILGNERGAEDAENTFHLEPWQRQLRGRIHEHQLGWLVPSVTFTVMGQVLLSTAQARVYDGSEYSPWAVVGGFGLHAISLVGVGSAELALHKINTRIDFERDPRDLVHSLRADGLGFLILALGGYTAVALAWAGQMQAWDYAPYPFVVFGLPMVFFPTGVLHVAFTHWAIADELERILRAGGDVAERPRAVRPRITGISPMGVTGVW